MSAKGGGGRHIAALAARLKDGIREQLVGVVLNGPAADSQRFIGNVNLSFPYVEGESLIMGLKVGRPPPPLHCSQQAAQPAPGGGNQPSRKCGFSIPPLVFPPTQKIVASVECSPRSSRMILKLPVCCGRRQ